MMKNNYLYKYYRAAICWSYRNDWRVVGFKQKLKNRTREFSVANAVAINRLEGSCECGKCGFIGFGASVVNFYSHSSAPRTVSKLPYLAAAGFRHDQVRWHGGNNLDSKPPPGSNNPHYRCKSCDTYLGVDAERFLGLIGLNLLAARRVDAEYRPNHHIFYDDRIVDIDDDLPKWATVPQGEMADTSLKRGNVVPSTYRGENFVEEDSRTAEGTKWDKSNGRAFKEVSLLGPFKSAEPLQYHFTEVDPPVGHRTVVSSTKIAERVLRKYEQLGLGDPSKFSPPPATSDVKTSTRMCDVAIIGGGHNGLTTAAYLARAGLDVVVLERRHCLGGAAVTEEIIPGFKFSRASYLAGLMRPDVVAELGLEQHGFEYIPRDVSSFTPTLINGPHEGKHLFMGIDEKMTKQSIAQWSEQDADALSEYECFLDGVRGILQPILDGPPPMNPFLANNARESARAMSQIIKIGRAASRNREVLVPLYELITGPASQILDRYFDSEVLKTTLACDAVIGAMVSPRQAGSAYVLLHHVMGEAAGRHGSWAYMRGGMGTISESIAAVAMEAGAEMVTEAVVRRIHYSDVDAKSGRARALGLELADGTHVMAAKAIVSGISPFQTFMELLPGYECSQGQDFKMKSDIRNPGLPRAFAQHIRHQDFSCGAFKINIAVDKLPNFACCPSNADGSPGPQHTGTIHFEERMDELENAYREAAMGVPATRPVIEMTIPSALDNTLSPDGKHVVQLFIQYAPYEVNPKHGNWADPEFKEAFVQRVFAIVEEHCPGFSSSIIGIDALSPLDLERIFALHKGNIFHGSMALHQLALARPAFGFADNRSPMTGLYMGSAGSHPGGGVMGAAGRNCAHAILSDLGHSII